MKPTAIAGLVVLALGIVALAYQGFTYTKRETIIDIGPLHATADHQKTVPISPVLGVAAVVGGALLLVVGVRKSA